ncbi:MAG: ECF-type sigma factor [Xanthomonadales bacterium]|nr:ECF-type sigma factor [Xanthomonadales bacterium]
MIHSSEVEVDLYSDLPATGARIGFIGQDSHESGSGPGPDGSSPEVDARLPDLYDELKRLARYHMARERAGHTLQTTALVHEAYLKLSSSSSLAFQDRAHFFAVAGQAMRRVLVDWARSRNRIKRGAGAEHESFEDIHGDLHPQPEQLLQVDAALEKLSRKDPGMTNVVVQRYFVGLSIPETAEALDLSERTVSRQWAAAKVWLGKELSDEQ